MAEKKTRIKLEDLPEDLPVSEEELRKVRGGLLLKGPQMKALQRLDLEKFRSPFGMDIDCW